MHTGRLRQEISRLFNGLEELRDELITRKPMARGTVYELKRRCGRPNCRCMRKGELHKQVCIAITRGGKKTLFPIQSEYIDRLEKLNEFHRRFRKARVRFIKLSGQIVELSTQLETEMLKPGDTLIEKSRKKKKRRKRQ